MSRSQPLEASPPVLFPRFSGPRAAECRSAILAALLVSSSGCGALSPGRHEASPAAIAASFAPHRGIEIAGEPVLDYLRRRTAMLVGGVPTLRVEAPAGRLDSDLHLSSPDMPASAEPSAALGAATAVGPDGFFLTSLHAVARAPVHALIETRDGVAQATARVVWQDEARDVALVHAPLRPEAWFTPAAERLLAAGEPVLAFCHAGGAAAGVLELDVDLPALQPYDALLIPHDTPLRGGFSGGPAVTPAGELLGVATSTGMDTLFTRRSFLVRVHPDLLERLMAAEREAVAHDARPGPRGDAVSRSGRAP